MWCFLGKFAKRKSLKPDLFRRAVGKAQSSPRKARGLSPTKSQVESISVGDQSVEESGTPEECIESSCRTAFEIVEEDASRSAFENEVREDTLLARDGSGEEDVREALGSLSPESSAESDDENDWANLKERSICVDTDQSNEEFAEYTEDLKHLSTTPQAETHDETEQNAASFLNHQADGSPTPASTAPRTEEAVPHESLADMQSEPSNSPSEEAAEEHINVAEFSSTLDVTPSSIMNTEPYEDEQVLRDALDLITIPESSETEKPSKSALLGIPHLSDKAQCEAQQEQAINIVCEDEDIEIEAAISKSSLNEDPASIGTEDSVSSQGNCSELGEAIRHDGQRAVSHDAVSLQDEPEILLVDSIPSLQPEGIRPSRHNQSPKPVVKLPIPTGSPTGRADLERAQDSEVDNAPTELPAKTTRSGARFSDDTNLLKDFLNRAQARKLAKDSKIPAHGPLQVSPRRSPRKVLAEVDRNSPSPQKPKDLATRPGTPPGKQRLDAFAFDDVDELTAEPTSCRRSNRTRLPTASKAALGAPSFIPVRRADGTDPVVLQKSIAQDLVVQTRANTRRNKGQSKPPKVALQTLTAETTEMIANRTHARETCKSVGWDEKLVYYQGVHEVVEDEGKEEKRPKVRRLRGLGGSNGTPALKRVADSGIPQGTPAPRRRGKAG